MEEVIKTKVKRNLGDKINSHAKICIFYAPVDKITFYWVLTMSGRVLVRLGGGIEKNRFRKKNNLKTFKSLC